MAPKLPPGPNKGITYFAASICTYMRFCFLLSIGLLAHGSAMAQEVLDVIASETCECTSTMDTTLTTEARNLALGICMLQSAEPYRKELKKKYKIDLDHVERDAEDLGRLVGFRMASKCPELFARIIRQNASLSTDEPPPAPSRSSEIIRKFTVQQTPGKLASVRSGQFLTLVVLAEDGRTLDLLLLGQAENVANLLRRPDQGRGATGIWSYAADELFDPLSRTFRPFYVITGYEAQ